MKNLFSWLALISTANISKPCADMIDVIMITNSEFVGDRDQILGTAIAIEKKLKDRNHTPILQEINGDSDKIDVKIKHATELRPAIIISCNFYGLNHLKTLKQAYNQKVFTLHVSHQTLKDQLNYTKTKTREIGIDVFAIPEHALLSSFERNVGETKLIKTIGVPHSWTQNDLNQEYESLKENFKDFVNKPAYLITLPGDTQRQDGSWEYYSEGEAKLYAKQTKEFLPKNAFVLVANGPRCAKFNPLTKQMRVITDSASPHKPDPVTHAFIEELKTSLPSESIRFYHFKDKPTFKALVRFIQKQPLGRVWIPGEAVIMISQIIDFIHPDRIKIATHSAMNEFHHRFVKSIAYTKGFNQRNLIMHGAKVHPTFMYKLYVPESHRFDKKSQSARDQIANVVEKAYFVSPQKK
jgi:hypothetical protein